MENDREINDQKNYNNDEGGHDTDQSNTDIFT